MFNKLKCLLGFHTFEDIGTIWQQPNHKIISYEQKCIHCNKEKITFLNQAKATVYNSFII